MPGHVDAARGSAAVTHDASAGAAPRSGRRSHSRPVWSHAGRSRSRAAGDDRRSTPGRSSASTGGRPATGRRRRSTPATLLGRRGRRDTSRSRRSSRPNGPRPALRSPAVDQLTSRPSRSPKSVGWPGADRRVVLRPAVDVERRSPPPAASSGVPSTVTRTPLDLGSWRSVQASWASISSSCSAASARRRRCSGTSATPSSRPGTESVDRVSPAGRKVRLDAAAAAAPGREQARDERGGAAARPWARTPARAPGSAPVGSKK